VSTPLHDALFAALSADTSIADLLGDPPRTRIYRGLIPQKQPGQKAKMPAVVINISTPDRQVANCGTVGTVMSRLQLDCYDLTHDGAWAVAAEVRSTLLDFRGMLGGTVLVRSASLENESEIVDLEPGLYRVLQTWAIWHKE